MDKEKITNLIDNLKFDLGDGLIACDIWQKGVGESIAGYNSQPKAAALFDIVTKNLDNTLIESGFGTLSEFYVLKLNNDSLVIVLLFKEYILGMLLDSKKITLNYTFTNLISKVRKSLSQSLY